MDESVSAQAFSSSVKIRGNFVKSPPSKILLSSSRQAPLAFKS